MHEKSGFFASFFRNISKTTETTLYFDKKSDRNHGISVYKKVLISEHRKNYIFRDNNCFIKMSVSLLGCWSVSLFVDELAQKLVLLSKLNFTRSFRPLRLRAD